MCAADTARSIKIGGIDVSVHNGTVDWKKVKTAV